MLRLLGKIVFLLSAITPSFALNWPIEAPTIQKDFASNSGFGFFPAAILKSKVQNRKVQPIEDGKLLYVHNNFDSRTRIPWGMSTAVIIQHSQGKVALYGGLEAETINKAKFEFKSTDKIGDFTHTTLDKGDHFYLQIFDFRKGGIINPFSILPPILDLRRPLVQDAYIVWEEPFGRQSLESRTEARGKTPVMYLNLIEYFQNQSTDPLILTTFYDLKIKINGKLWFSINKSQLRLKNGELVLSEQSTGRFGNMFGSDGYMRIGELPIQAGVNKIEAQAHDYFGFTANGTWRIIKSDESLKVLSP